ncbi:thiamine pyrophosphate-dependent enzyme [Orrella marina]|uniref:Aldehyde dehydrogenase n=1 Tax=Orrella marina TaxID=2163011 RepID=A0A2R4XNQ9_9BURK|nr:thiamine pyrophosphate-dependent enzyme [Orrella marina]AWB35431.1 aldehyde dehydrogenase [Orrella marina]
MTDVNKTDAGIDRRAFVKSLVQACPDALIVAGLGSSTYDLYAAGDRPNNFYLWGAMGGAAAIGLGLALAQPERDIIVLTGDGEQLMGLGMLATTGAQQPANLTIVVLDNGHFGETGMQHSHTSLGTDLVALAKATSFKQALLIDNAAGVNQIQSAVSGRTGPALFQVKVRAEELPRALPMRDGVQIKNRFRAELGFEPI